MYVLSYYSDMCYTIQKLYKNDIIKHTQQFCFGLFVTLNKYNNLRT